MVNKEAVAVVDSVEVSNWFSVQCRNKILYRSLIFDVYDIIGRGGGRGGFGSSGGFNQGPPSEVVGK